MKFLSLLLIFVLILSSSLRAESSNSLMADVYGVVHEKINPSLIRLVDTKGESHIVDFSYCSLKTIKRELEVGDEIGLLYYRSENENLKEIIESFNYITTWFYRREVRSAEWSEPKHDYDGVAIAMYYNIKETLAFSYYDPNYIDVHAKLRDIQEIQLLGMQYLNSIKLNDQHGFKKLFYSRENDGDDGATQYDMEFDWFIKDLHDIRESRAESLDWNAINTIVIGFEINEHSDEVNIKINFKSNEGDMEWQIITGSVVEQNNRLYFANRCRIPLVRLK